MATQDHITLKKTKLAHLQPEAHLQSKFGLCRSRDVLTNTFTKKALSVIIILIGLTGLTFGSANYYSSRDLFFLMKSQRPQTHVHFFHVFSTNCSNSAVRPWNACVYNTNGVSILHGFRDIR